MTSELSKPFLGIVIWSLIIAIAVDEPFEWLCEKLGGRRSLAAFISVTAVLLGLFVPTVIFSETMISGGQDVAQQLKAGTINVPTPNESIREIPFVGQKVFDGWIAANENLETRMLPISNTGDRPIQVGSHFHFYEVNSALEFDRDEALGFRLNIAAGTAVRFEPGMAREVEIVALAGSREVHGLNAKVNGPLPA